MAKVAVFLIDMFEDMEYIEPTRAFRKAGHELTHVGFEEDKIVKGARKGTPVRIERSLKDISADQFDALLIPRSRKIYKLRINREADELLKQFIKKRKPIFTTRRKAS